MGNVTRSQESRFRRGRSGSPPATPGALEALIVDPPGPILNDHNAPGFAEVALRIAEEINAADRFLWAEVERLSAAGQPELVREIATRRRTASPRDVAAWLRKSRPSAA
jgi:hypothetical protein